MFNAVLDKTMKILKNCSRQLMDKTKELTNRYDINKIYAAYYQNHHAIEYETTSTERRYHHQLSTLSEEFIFSTPLWPNQPIVGWVLRVDDNKLAFVRPPFPDRNQRLLIQLFDQPDHLIQRNDYTEFTFDQPTLESTEYYVHLNLDSEYVHNEVLKNQTIWNRREHPDKVITVADEQTVVRFKSSDPYVRDQSSFLVGSKWMESEVLHLEGLWNDLDYHLRDHATVHIQNQQDIESTFLASRSVEQQQPILALFLPNNEGRCVMIMATQEYKNPVKKYSVMAPPFEGINPHFWSNTMFNYIHFRFEFLGERNYTALNFLRKALRGDLMNADRTFDQLFREDCMNYDALQNQLSR